MPNKMLWHTEHIGYIPMVQESSVCTLQSEHIPCIPVVLKRSVCTCQTCQMKCYCTLNIYSIYKWFRIVGLHMSNMPNKMILHFKHITYIPMVQKLPVCTCQT